MMNKKMWLGSLVAFLTLAVAMPVSAKTTQQILDSTLSHLQEAKTMNFSGTINTKTKYKKVKSSSEDIFSMFPAKDNVMKMSFKGAVDVTDTEYEKTQIDLTFSAPIAGVNKNVSIKMTQAGKSYYFFLSSPELEKLAGGMIDLSVLTNKWIEFNLDSFLEQAKGMGLNITSGSLSSVESIDLIKQKAIVKSLQKNKVVKAVRWADGKMNGQPAHHLVLSLNRVGLQNFIIDSAKISGETITAAEKKDLTKKITALKLPNIDLWVDKVNNYPLRLSFRFVSDSKYYTTTSDVLINMSGFGKPVAIEVPFYAEPIESVFNKLKEQFAPTTTDTSTISSTTVGLNVL